MTAAADTGKLRILHMTNGSDAGGLSRYIYNLSIAMHAQGHEVAVAGERGAWHWLFEKAPFPWIEIPVKGGPISLLRSASILNKHLAGHPVDILHSHYRRGTLIGRRLQKHRGGATLPILYTLHLSHIPIGWPQRIFSDFGDHTHVASEQARQWLTTEARVDPSRITLIPHGIDPGKFPLADDAARAGARAALGLAPEDRVGAFVGRLDYPKNVDWVLDVADAAARKGLGNLRLLLAGEGPQEAALRAEIQERKLGQVVRLLGHRDPLPVYQASDALLLPSLREGFSLVTAEAMSVGVPVLRTRTSGSAELILEGVNGATTAIDRAAFVAAALDFLAEPAKLRAMGRAAAEHVRANFTFERQLERTIDLYRKLIPAAAPAPAAAGAAAQVTRP
jgi:glycosyltransferase involved in cell wall biosynthesis